MNSKTRVRFILLICFFNVFKSLKSQEEFNNSKSWGIELQGSKFSSLTRVGTNVLFRSNRNCYFGGVGIGYNINNYRIDPIVYLGYRKYPGKTLSSFKFFYQTFLFYSSSYYPLHKPILERYITANFGVGLEYDISKRFSAGISSNLGAGWDLYTESMIYTFFPIQIALSYKFSKN